MSRICGGQLRKERGVAKPAGESSVSSPVNTKGGKEERMKTVDEWKEDSAVAPRLHTRSHFRSPRTT